MALITQFDDLPDLFFIDLFNYLSSIDILWAFTNLNNRIQTLINERGFFRHINLSSARLSKFDTLLTILPLNQIETLIIDIEASPLQLTRWPYLSHLTTLRLYGLRDFIDATNFILRHSASLIHLTLETNNLFMSMGFTGHIGHPRGRLPILAENVLPHLNALCSLDLGQDTGFGLTNWYITTIQCPLNYLRVSMTHIPHLCHVMSRETLSTTLEQLHVTMRSQHVRRKNSLPKGLVLSKMINLHTFTLVQSIFYRSSRIEWSTIESLTASNVMPALRRMDLAIFITVDDLDCINRSSLFMDDRRIDIQFAFIIDDTSRGNQLSHYVPHGSRFHPRQIVGFDSYPLAYDVWYTLPWAFEQFFDSVVPIQYITKVEVFALPPSYSSIIYSSRLRTLHISENDSLPSIISMPHVVQQDHINTVHLSFHDWPTGLNLLALRHVTLTNNLVALKNFSSFPSNIRSIQILFRANMPNFVSSNWSTLRSLSALPMLTSLHIVINDMNTGLDDISCQIIAETVPMFVNFGICFRRDSGMPPCDSVDHCIEFDPALIDVANDFTSPIIDDEDDEDNEDGDYEDCEDGDYEDYEDDQDDDLAFLESIFDFYRASIKELHRRILCLPFHMKPLIVIEEGGCGLTVWL
ncbi:unnamed protein product [Rotaria magnacalcarata]|uniref:F-box domain-containing protein n=1 Tax=Rotaria magnacalcarata TaxID=392030 RepID=A0A820AJ28_9BILA|nr:unnamed protein product [Rotaria magnacalcarata]